MKGLLLKDFYLTFKRFKLYLWQPLIFWAIMFCSEESTMFCGVPLVLSGMLPTVLLNYDENSGWLEYSGTMPYTERQIVSSKYLIGLLFQLLIFSSTIILLFIRGLFYKSQNITVNIITLTVILVVSLITPAIRMPFCFKFGSDKGSAVYCLVNSALGALSMLMYFKITDMLNGAVINETTKTQLSGLLEMDIPGFVIPMIIGAVLIFYIASWVVSIPLLKSVKR